MVAESRDDADRILKEARAICSDDSSGILATDVCEDIGGYMVVIRVPEGVLVDGAEVRRVVPQLEAILGVRSVSVELIGRA